MTLKNGQKNQLLQLKSRPGTKRSDLPESEPFGGSFFFSKSMIRAPPLRAKLEEYLLPYPMMLAQSEE